MSSRASRLSGATLIEILVVLTIVGILAASAVPRLDRFLDLVRARSALDLVVAEVYRTRMMAVESGRSARLVLGSGESTCVGRLRIEADGPGATRVTTSTLDASSICVRHNGDSVLHFSARGMLRPPGRSIFAVSGSGADSVVVSIAGRVRRTY